MKVLKHKRDQKVVVAFPRHSDVSGRFMVCLDHLRQHDFKHFRRIADGGGIVQTQTSIVAQGRNELVRMFLDHHDADWLWFIDTDMTFDPDILDDLVEAAHPRDRPIMGALCFSIQHGVKACPTLYVVREDQAVGRVFDYPRNSLMRCLTGTGCLLIHRSVFEKMRDAKGSDGTRKLYPKPYEWFRDTALGELPVGEDITFCIRAESLGMPVHVNTAIKCGHEKRFIVDEAMYDAQQGVGIIDNDLALPTYVVMAGKDRHEMTGNLMAQLQLQNPNFIALFDNGSDPPYPQPALLADGMPLHEMWNTGLGLAEKAAKEATAEHWNVLVINNDVSVPPDFLKRLEWGLRQDPDHWIAYPNWHGVQIPDGVGAIMPKSGKGDGRTLSGWAFMIAGESGLRFDEQFAWWYGDADIQRQAEAAGKHVVAVGGCFCDHLDPMKSTIEDPERLAQAEEDEAKFAAKWGLDPANLWLAQNRARL
jgi:GT2 family glycosyltransferase